MKRSNVYGNDSNENQETNFDQNRLLGHSTEVS